MRRRLAVHVERGVRTSATISTRISTQVIAVLAITMATERATMSKSEMMPSAIISIKAQVQKFEISTGAVIAGAAAATLANGRGGAAAWVDAAGVADRSMGASAMHASAATSASAVASTAVSVSGS